jgi:conjugative transposon TraN protein
MSIRDWFLMGVLTGVLGGLGLSAAAQDPGFRLEGIGSAPVPVTTEKMTNLIFPEAVQTGVKVSRDVLAQKVRGVENVIELKALRRGFQTTNLSVYGKDGRLYSFVLQYAPDSTVLNFRVVPGERTLAAAGSASAAVMLSGLPADLVTLRLDAVQLAGRRPFLHRSAHTAGLKVELAGMYLRDSLEWLVLEVADRSQIPFLPGYARFFVQDRKAVKRKAVQEWSLGPVYNGMPAEVRGEQRVRFAVGFTPFTVPPDKRLVVELAGLDGGRTVELTIKSKVLLRARKG